MSTRRARKQVVQWTLDEIESSGTERRIASRTVRKFPQHFRGNIKANLAKALGWFKERECILAVPDHEVARVSHRVFRRRLANGKGGVARKDIIVKAGSGRGWNQLPWSVSVQNTLITEFARLSRAVLKFNGVILRMLAKKILINEDQHLDLPIIMEAEERRKLTHKIMKRWVQAFMEGLMCCREGCVASLW